MSPNTAAIMGLLFLFLLMALRMPVSFAMILAGFLGNAYLISTDAAIYVLATNIWGQFSSYGLSVIPLFVLMGQFAFHSGIPERLYNAAYKWVGRLPGNWRAVSLPKPRWRFFQGRTVGQKEKPLILSRRYSHLQIERSWTT